MNTAVIAVTKGGKALAARIARELPGTVVSGDKGVAGNLADNWKHFDAFICIMATGIVVRSIAPLLNDKRTDPSVVVLDENGRYVISLLSGHLGGGNQLAREVAAITDGDAVITTASDTLGLVALDLWASKQNLAASKKDITKASLLLVNKGRLSVYTDIKVDSLPSGIYQTTKKEEADIIISNRDDFGDTFKFYPRNLVLGVGCNRNTPLDEFELAMAELLDSLKLSHMAIRNLASIDIKKDEKGLLAFAEKHGWAIDFFTKDDINSIKGINISKAALSAVGVVGVAEPSALLSASANVLLGRKRKWQNITIAVAEAPFTLSAQVLDL